MGNDLIKQIKDKFSNKLIDFHERSSRRIYLEIQPSDIKEVVKYIFSDLSGRFVIMTGVDTPKGLGGHSLMKSCIKYCYLRDAG